MSGVELTLTRLGIPQKVISFRVSSSTMSGGGLTLLSSNSAASVTGRNDLVNYRSNLRPSATISLGSLIQDFACQLKSAMAGLSRFEILSSYHYLVSRSGNCLLRTMYIISK